MDNKIERRRLRGRNVSDFSKAFDTVPHGRLLAKLTGYTVDTRVLAEKFMPKPGPLSLGGRLIRGTDF